MHLLGWFPQELGLPICKPKNHEYIPSHRQKGAGLPPNPATCEQRASVDTPTKCNSREKGSSLDKSLAGLGILSPCATVVSRSRCFSFQYQFRGPGNAQLLHEDAVSAPVANPRSLRPPARQSHSCPAPPCLLLERKTRQTHGKLPVIPAASQFPTLHRGLFEWPSNTNAGGKPQFGAAAQPDAIPALTWMQKELSQFWCSWEEQSSLSFVSHLQNVPLHLQQLRLHAWAHGASRGSGIGNGAWFSLKTMDFFLALCWEEAESCQGSPASCLWWNIKTPNSAHSPSAPPCYSSKELKPPTDVVSIQLHGYQPLLLGCAAASPATQWL